MATMAASQKAVASALMPVDLTRIRSNTNAIQGSVRAQRQGTAQQMPQPSSDGRIRKRHSSAIESIPAGSQVCRSFAQPQLEASTTFALIEVLVELKDGNEVDLDAIRMIYERFWMECQRCYIFEMDEKREVRINQLDFAYLDLTI